MAVLPTLSHAWAAQRGDAGWVTVCTPQGMKLVAADLQSDGDEAPVSAAGHLEHCPYCAPSAPALGLPPAPQPPLQLPVATTAPPPLFLHAPRPLYAWHPASPRAPPFSA